ncbi:hypothetical protein AXF42_Ash000055 [Apostasia shenzhenica]|uniref:Uncharacterized protein n=1 Tax=Apostasia shenzhenica TaxID=1088818 RepID=A0A2I0AF97_9ASPA|nr:hypothetical protein AXF42_Ash000053 [Apostasia shenzhenica]PKA54221.1 hypothetical protein AXF42_Ash000054 [Apostasia shenzhenica]PKA54222.1 hypothetical protein AXF42_Ash000055 [Apostasia shenzhenica]
MNSFSPLAKLQQNLINLQENNFISPANQIDTQTPQKKKISEEQSQRAEGPPYQNRHEP